MTQEQAHASGYRALTTGYKLPKNEWVVQDVEADMARGSIDCVRVDTADGVEIWRKNSTAQPN